MGQTFWSTYKTITLWLNNATLRTTVEHLKHPTHDPYLHKDIYTCATYYTETLETNQLGR